MSDDIIPQIYPCVTNEIKKTANTNMVGINDSAWNNTWICKLNKKEILSIKIKYRRSFLQLFDFFLFLFNQSFISYQMPPVSFNIISYIPWSIKLNIKIFYILRLYYESFINKVQIIVSSYHLFGKETAKILFYPILFSIYFYIINNFISLFL